MTLIAAWKLPHKENSYDQRGIRVIADSMLSDGSRDPITDEWIKIHTIRPQVHLPVSSIDEEWSEAFNHWSKHYYKPFGLFFAGASLPFNFVKEHVREVVENLGLKLVYTQGNCETYLRTDIVRHENAERYKLNEYMDGKHFHPPPPLNLNIIVNIVAEEFKRFYDSQPSGAFVITPGQPNHGMIRYGTLIGIAGYCETTQQCRLFKLTPEEDTDEAGIVISIPKITVSEITENELLLLGSTSHHAELLKKIDEEQASLVQSDEVDRPTLARQAVIEREISSGNIPGVGGDVRRAEVHLDCGFKFVSHLWTPAEAIDFNTFDF